MSLKLDRRALVARRPGAAKNLLMRFRQLLRRYVHDTSAVRELSQSASADLFRRLRDEPQASTRQFDRWTRNSAINALQRSLRRRRRQVLELTCELHASPDPDLEELLAVREKLGRIDAVLEQLRPVDEQALVAKVFGHSDAEIATQLDSTPGTVRSSVSRTRAALRLSLTKDECRDTLQQIVRDAKLRREHEGLPRVHAAESSSR